MTIEELQQNLLVQTPANEVLKVSTVYSENRVSAQVVYPVQPRTTVKYYGAVDVARWREPSKAMIAKYEQAWGVAR